MNPNVQKVKLAWKLLVLSLVLVQYGCDVLEEDVKPSTGNVKVETSRFYSLPNSPTYIDLNSLIKTQSQVQLRIVSQPRKGNLSELSKGVVQYFPNKDFTSGNDAFRFSVLSTDDKLLLQDSIVIVVGKDINTLPCGIYTQTDSVLTPLAGPVVIDVLKNDSLCDRVNVRVEVYKPAANAVPLFGTAVVVSENKILYTPGAGFAGIDYIFYKVTSTLDSSKHSYGKVAIKSSGGSGSAGQFSLGIDHYMFKKDSLSSDTLKLFVFQNDMLNGGTGFQASIASPPQHGSATVNGLLYIKYVLAKPVTIRTDSLTYKVCKGTDCKTAKAYIKLY